MTETNGTPVVPAFKTRRFWEKWVGLPIGLLALLGCIYLGLAHTVLSPTFGDVRIDSPQVYTRERLVNDRFREQAWLEARLRAVDDQQNVVSEVLRRVSTATLSADIGKQDAATGSADAKPDPIAALKEVIASQTDLVEFDDRFHKLQSYRETLRRELIENELDDRHDLGSNSLYLFKFGAAISPGPRTKSPLLIEMRMSPHDTPPPMGFVAPATPRICDRLYDFECAFLVNYLYEDFTFESGSDPRPKLRAWDDVYRRWADDVEFRRRTKRNSADEYLLSATLRNQMFDKVSPVMVKIERAMKKVTDELVAGLLVPQDFAGDCNFLEKSQYKTERNLEEIIYNYFDRCLASYNGIIEKIDDKRMFEENFGLNKNIKPIIQFYYKGDEKLARLDQSIKFILNTTMASISKNCAFDGYVIKAPSPAAETANSGKRYSIDMNIVPVLADCARPAFQDGLASLDSTVQTIGGGRPDEVTNVLADGRPNDRRIASTYDVRGVERYSEVDELRIWLLSADILSKNEALTGARIAFPRDCAARTGSGPNVIYSGYYVGNIEPLLQKGQSGGKMIDNNVPPHFGQTFVDRLICSVLAKQGQDTDGELELGRKLITISVPVGLFRFIKKLSEAQRSFSYSVSPRADFDLRSESIATSRGLGISALLDQVSGKSEVSDTTASSRIGKRHRVLGFGSQSAIPTNASPGGRKTRFDGTKTAPRTPDNNGDANFGWYVLPSSDTAGWFSSPKLQPSNESLSAVVSVPAWWPSVIVNVDMKWLDPDTMEVTHVDNTDSTQFQIDLPVRMEFIQNLLVDKRIEPPTLDLLRLNTISVTACQPASLLIPGDRLWRSTVVTLGAQKSVLIEVMPDMEGIIAKFDKILPGQLPEQGGFLSYLQQQNSMPTQLAVWTSEGNRLASEIVTIVVPDAVKKNIQDGKDPCYAPVADASPAQ